MLLGINVIVHGGSPERVFAGLDSAVYADVLAALTGYFLHVSRLPDPPGLPTVRAFQRAQGDALLPWVKANLGKPGRP